MTLAGRWSELERSTPEQPGRMRQRVFPESPIDLFISFSGIERRPSLELYVDASAVDGLNLPAGSKGVTVELESRGDRAALIIELLDIGARDIFEALCDDVAEVTSRTADDVAAVATWTGRLARWMRLLQRGGGGLSPERQRGLYAELWFLGWFGHHIGIDDAVTAWRGPDGEPRDFEHRARGVETKASAANEPQVVKINGERQLDDSGLTSLHLVHLSLEPVQGGTHTLPGLIHQIRSSVEHRACSGAFEDALLVSGYLDAHAPRYQGTGYVIRRTSCFRVVDGFPRITEQHLADGVGSVQYRLAIDACRDYETDLTDIANALQED